MKEKDINEERELFKLMAPHVNFDGVYKFYYDETNNIKKLSVREDDFNVAFQSNFILGGLVFDGEEINLDELFKALKLQDNIVDVKLKHIAQGDLLDCLKSKKLDYFLSYLVSKKVLIHFRWVNLLFWSVADIVDSAVANSEVGMKVGRVMVDKVKSDFYKFAKIEFDAVVELFFKYQYPNLKKGEVVAFIDELEGLFSEYLDDEELHFGLESLRQVLKEARFNSSMPFLENEVDHVLLKDFAQFYLGAISLFKYSTHVFDNEADIIKVFQTNPLCDGDKELANYSFVDSKDNKLVQASDIVVGIIGKLTHFININSHSDIFELMESLNEIQKRNFDSLIKLIDLSVNYNPGFQVMIDAQEEIEKFHLIRDLRGL